MIWKLDLQISDVLSQSVSQVGIETCCFDWEIEPNAFFTMSHFFKCAVDGEKPLPDESPEPTHPGVAFDHDCFEKSENADKVPEAPIW